jgi:hypothetical protein
MLRKPARHAGRIPAGNIADQAWLAHNDAPVWVAGRSRQTTGTALDRHERLRLADHAQTRRRTPYDRVVPDGV